MPDKEHYPHEVMQAPHEEPSFCYSSSQGRVVSLFLTRSITLLIVGFAVRCWRLHTGEHQCVSMWNLRAAPIIGNTGVLKGPNP